MNCLVHKKVNGRDGRNISIGLDLCSTTLCGKKEILGNNVQVICSSLASFFFALFMNNVISIER